MPDPGGLLECLLLMADEPLTSEQLAECCALSPAAVEAELTHLAQFYDDHQRGFTLRRVAGGWRYYTRPEYAEAIGQWLIEGQPAKLSQAALETLSVIAYLQPISRSRVGAVRGVNVDGVVRSLTARGLVAETGVDETSGAVLFSTTALFLEKMGMNSLDELPDLAPHLPEAQALEAELAAMSAPPEVHHATDVGQKDENHD